MVIDLKTREGIEETIKAGVLEQGTVDLMCQTGVGDRMRRDGFVHRGINLAFSGAIHRVDLFELSGGRTTDPGDWSDDRIWEEIQARVGTAGATIKTGKIFAKGVLQFRRYVYEPMQYGRLFLAGDAAHTVPPTGAKGLNLAVADVHVLDRALGAYYQARDSGLLEAYTQTVLRRVWRAQHFSWWMTSMLHRFSEATDFDLRRQIAELETVTSSPAGARLLAENYTGLPLT